MMKKNIAGLFIFCLFFYSLAFAFVPETKAQGTGIAISPVIIDELVDPGQTLSRQIKVTNQSDVPRVFYVYLRDFGAEGETGQARLLPPGADYGYSIATWIDITTEGIEFAPNQERVISYKINVPEGAGPGGYRGAILFGTEPPRIQIDSEDKGAGMSVAQQTASLVLLQLKGEVDERASIREFNTDKDFYSTPFDVDFLIRVDNTGNVHVKPSGTIKISNMFGKEVAVIRVNEKGGNILPDSVRRFIDIRWSGNNAFGKYTATLGMTFGTSPDDGGQGKQSLVAEKSFWIIPWRIIIPLSLTLLLVSLFLFFMLRVYRDKAVKKAMERAGLKNVKYTKSSRGPSPAMHLATILLASFIMILIIFVAIYFLFIA